jgi:hypothetical protein
MALANMRRFYAALPDVELIAKIAGLPYTEPHTLPLFLYGLRAMAAPESVKALPAAKLDYAGPWITWLGV